VGSQMIRAADSISANIAEGYGRFHFRESIQFINYARGSAYETLDWIEKIKHRELSQAANCASLKEKLELVIKQINGYNKYLKKKLPQ
jgi:four helix bundle protein